MGDLEFSEVIFSIQNDLYNWGARDYFLLNLSKICRKHRLNGINGLVEENSKIYKSMENNTHK